MLLHSTASTAAATTIADITDCGVHGGVVMYRQGAFGS